MSDKIRGTKLRIVINQEVTEIPCGIGDAVYVKTIAGLEPVTIDAVQIKAHGIRIRGRRFARPGMDILYLDPNELGIKWFVTCADAEMNRESVISASGEGL